MPLLGIIAAVKFSVREVRRAQSDSAGFASKYRVPSPHARTLSRTSPDMVLQFLLKFCSAAGHRLEMILLFVMNLSPQLPTALELQSIMIPIKR